MSASFASAEVTFSGTAAAGWAKDGGVNTSAANNMAAKGAALDGVTETYSEIAITASASVTTDSGVTLSAAASIDGGTGYDFADDDGFDTAKTNGVGMDSMSISGAFGKLTIDGQNTGTSNNVGGGGGDMAMLVDDDNETGDVSYSHTVGGFGLSIVADTSKAAVDTADVAWSAAVTTDFNGAAIRVATDEEGGSAASIGYTMNGLTVTLGTKTEYSTTNAAKGKADSTVALAYALDNGLGLTYKASNLNDGNDYSYGVSYTINGIALAYSSDEVEKWATTATYALGSGASLLYKQNYTGDMQMGMAFSF
jgi:hypothetical protein